MLYLTIFLTKTKGPDVVTQYIKNIENEVGKNVFIMNLFFVVVVIIINNKIYHKSFIKHRPFDL